MVGQCAHRRFRLLGALSVPRWRALILSRLPRRPATQMFEDSANDYGVIDQRDYVHRRAALGACQRIDFIDLVDHSRPRRSAARFLRPSASLLRIRTPLW